MSDEIFLEIYPIDKSLRITAIDARTGIEVVFAAPNYTPRERIEAIASGKLKARIKRESRDLAAQAPKPVERGKLV